MELHAAQLPGAEVPGVQLRRERAGYLPRPRHPALQPARPDRRAGDRRLRDQLDRRLQLHPRRVPRRARAAVRGGARGRLCRRAARQEHPRQRHRLRPPYLHRRRRLHLRRGDRAARFARGQARQAALQAAISGELRAVRRPDHHQQHAELRLGADHPAQRPRVVRRARTDELGRHADLLRLGTRRAAGQLRAAARRAVRRPAAAGRRDARRPPAQGGDPRRCRRCRWCRRRSC